MLHYPLMALIAFNPTVEINEVRSALDRHIPGHHWDLREVGDGNINYIYIADGDDRKILLKKALDYARINPEAFPLPIERLFFEHKAYTLYQATCPARIPEIYFFDIERGCLAMQYLTPHLILRKGLIAGNKYPHVAEHLGVFLGRSLYLTSRYHLSQDSWKQNALLFNRNTAMHDIILNLNFTDPFYGSPLNRWTSPELDDLVAAIQEDEKLKKTVDDLKEKFLNNPEALSHGDLHSGSILVTESDTRIFDTEFAAYAPISFDIGMLLANFVTSSLSSPGHHLDADWISSQIGAIWVRFEETFRELWERDESSLEDKLTEVWSDTLKLIGVEIIRRTIGLAHNAEFETIKDRGLKVLIERRALNLARTLLSEAESAFPDAEALSSHVRQLSS